LSLTGNFEVSNAKQLIEKWFGSIPSQPIVIRNLPQEPEQKEGRSLTLNREVPQKMIMIGYPMSDRLSQEYYIADIISEIAGNGKSSRFYKKFVKEMKVFSETSAFITGSLDKGLLCFYARINDDITVEKAEQLIKQELSKFAEEKVNEDELTSMKNRYELGERLERMGFLNTAMQLCYFEFLEDAELINQEMDKYTAVSPEQIQNWARQNIIDEKCNVLHYLNN
jgi:predicted Zn-dependent peptidase